MTTTTYTDALNAAVNAPADALAGNAAMPCITVPADATVSVDDPTITFNDAFTALADLIKDQKVWKDGAHRTANEELYLLLQRCYGLYKAMSSGDEAKAKVDQALNSHLNLRGLADHKFKTGLHKVIGCVFGIKDRRRVSAYAVALRVADDDGTEVANLPAYLRDAGGVEEVRKSKSGDAKADKAAKANNKIKVAKDNLTASLATVEDKALSSRLTDKTALNGKVVLIATQGANGALIINALEDSEAVVNAALGAIYAKNKKEWEVK
ncbi:hypothetical protein [Novosphingobium humi]|uniref:hypothetical protein n=1 Tax=Novosphingobium humi TaxID=2282397 RepID=UPI0025B18F41|nr:hypothetical protein [Novosphingobium humi]WJS99863.1 hypothetical protein NYQ05_06925 [Novosphingobium humi]